MAAKKFKHVAEAPSETSSVPPADRGSYWCVVAWQRFGGSSCWFLASHISRFILSTGARGLFSLKR